MIIAIKRTDGGVSILRMVDDLSVDKALRDWQAAHPNQYISHREITEEILPQDKTFRDAWTDDLDTPTVDVCMEKAKKIHMGRIRAARQEKFTELGFPVRLNPEIEAAILTEETRHKLQALRDTPQKLDLSTARSPKDLIAIWPF